VITMEGVRPDQEPAARQIVQQFLGSSADALEVVVTRTPEGSWRVRIGPPLVADGPSLLPPHVRSVVYDDLAEAVTEVLSRGIR
jgi:hypothetical protein